jgi:hypothetical protein
VTNERLAPRDVIYLISKGGIMSINTQRTIAVKHCANYSCGDCMGVMMRVKRRKSALGLIRTKLLMWIDSAKAGKPCDIETGCHYFDNLVNKSVE